MLLFVVCICVIFHSKLTFQFNIFRNIVKKKDENKFVYEKEKETKQKMTFPLVFQSPSIYVSMGKTRLGNFIHSSVHKQTNKQHK